MDLGMFDRFCPSLETRDLIDERKFDMNRSDRYVIPMHERMSRLTSGCKILERNFLQTRYHNPSAQYKRGWGSFKRKRGLTLCNSCRRPRHLAKEFSGGRHSCLFCKALDHEVLDFPRMIAKMEGVNLKEEKLKADPEITKPQRESDNMLLQIQDTLNDHQHVILSEVFNKKQFIEVRIGDFDVECVLDEETHVNVMTERTWEAIGRPDMTPSLSGIGLFRGKLVNLFGRLNQISMNANGTSTEEDFEIIKFIEDNAPFTMLLGNPWIERDQARKKEEEKVLEQQRQELK
jgi:hypothetical protein